MPGHIPLNRTVFFVKIMHNSNCDSDDREYMELGKESIEYRTVMVFLLFANHILA